MNRHPQHCLFVLFLFLFCRPVAAQIDDRTPFFVPADSLDKARFWTCLGAGAAIYSGASIALYHAWYKDYELGGFRTFDDAGEWLQSDKAGHFFTTYLESRLAYKGARWTGISSRPARWVGVGVGMLLQSTVEVMDGFSVKWGFSWSDMGFNALGAGFFLGQEMLWSEQRMLVKVSNTPPRYSNTPVFSVSGSASSSPAQRAADLYGISFAETFLKDYNGQTTWISINPVSFLSKDRQKTLWPRWLNVAVGYGAENLFGGFGNSWQDEAGNRFSLPIEDYPRYRQFYLSLDVDLDRIPVRSPFLRTLLTVVSWIKAPSPSLEFNTRGGVHFHPFFW